MDIPEEVNKETDVNNDPDVNIDSWTFINNKSEIESKIQVVSDEDLGSNCSDSDGFSVISETDECRECLIASGIIKNNKINEIETTNSTHSSTEHSESTENTSESILDENVSDISDDLEHNLKKYSNINKVMVFTTVTGLSLVASYLFLVEKSMNAPRKDTNNIENQYSNSITNEIETIDYEYCETQHDTALNYINTIPKINLTSNYTSDIQLDNRNTDQNYCLVKNKEKKQKTKSHRTKSHDRNHQNKLKMKEQFLTKKDKYLNRKENYLKKLEKTISQMEANLRKTYKRINNEMKRNLKNKERKYKKRILKKYSNVTGEWYGKMNTGRLEIRNKEKKSDWIFERSKMRSKLRDKANWYFQRANSREDYRFQEKRKIHRF